MKKHTKLLHFATQTLHRVENIVVGWLWWWYTAAAGVKMLIFQNTKSNEVINIPPYVQISVVSDSYKRHQSNWQQLKSKT